MSKVKRPMIDPSAAAMGGALTPEELAFVDENRSGKPFVSQEKTIEKTSSKKVKKAKPRTLSMSDDFFDSLTDFVDKFPEEGSRSALIVRVVSDYMKLKTKSTT